MSADAITSRPTSLDVARHAGVSRSTVSQVLNGSVDRFPQETRHRVEAAAAELGYRPSRAGRALVTGTSDVIVIAVPNVTFGRHLQDAVDGIARATASRGMSVVVRYAGDDDAATLTAVLDLRPAVVVDLGVFSSPESRRIIQSGGTRVAPNLDAVRSIEDPNHLIGRLQARHLLQDPSRRLVMAYLTDDRTDSFSAGREQGVIDEAREQGHLLPLHISVPIERAGAQAALESAIRQAPGKSLGICCYNDDVAIAVLAAARALALSVPDELAIIGVDNTAVGQLVEPRLTTIATDMTGWLGYALADIEMFADFAHDASILADPPFVRLIPGETT